MACLPDDRFRVEDTNSVRGLGLFVGESAISEGTYLMDYGGKVLEQAEYDRRYPTGGEHEPDYAVAILRSDGRTSYVDAAREKESNLARYMNHAEGDGANCVAWTLSEPAVRVMLFAAHDLAAGEELCWDYGAAYWECRSAEKV